MSTSSKASVGIGALAAIVLVGGLIVITVRHIFYPPPPDGPKPVKSYVKQITDKQWHVYIYPDDGLFDTGIQFNDGDGIWMSYVSPPSPFNRFNTIRYILNGEEKRITPGALPVRSKQTLKMRVIDDGKHMFPPFNYQLVEVNKTVWADYFKKR